MAVADGRCDDDEGAAALFKEEGVDYADDIDHSDTPIHLRPLASTAESGNLDALRQAVDAFDVWSECRRLLVWKGIRLFTMLLETLV
ncbi:hypothetical protein SASPL_112766 [Salvia splendens]|uniref:Uncharacterized protein n=1 Tax=Salvia splendens TaxID=180675 RepID=A0A8X8YBU0_SALSN|nr:hypothetical protein SASPL_112766 [Salvia splendens]